MRDLQWCRNQAPRVFHFDLRNVILREMCECVEGQGVPEKVRVEGFSSAEQAHHEAVARAQVQVPVPSEVQRDRPLSHIRETFCRV